MVLQSPVKQKTIVKMKLSFSPRLETARLKISVATIIITIKMICILIFNNNNKNNNKQQQH